MAEQATDRYNACMSIFLAGFCQRYRDVTLAEAKRLIVSRRDGPRLRVLSNRGRRQVPQSRACR